MGERQTIFVTGASGFIAKHIVLQLLQSGRDVVGSVRSEARAEETRAAVSARLGAGGDPGDRLRFVTLDLESDAGWPEALRGTDALLHTASPFPLTQPKDAEAVIRPAVQGTLRALRAARDAGVGRVVLTSSVVAITNGTRRKPVYSEADWSDPDLPQATAYERAKTMAERAAWDFVAAEAPGIALTAINPALVVGAPLDRSYGTSLQLVERLMKGRDPMLPDIGFGIVDVTDIARMHVAALDTPDSVGRRFIGADRFITFVEVARTLKAAYPDRRIPTRVAPDLLIRALGLFDPAIATIRPHLGEVFELDASAARETLGINFTPADAAIRASGAFLVEAGLV